MKKVAIIISPNWRDYGKKYLADCLASIRAQDYLGESKIFLIDNESIDDSYGFLKKVLSEVYPASDNSLGGAEIIREEKNEGFAKANNDAMRLALEQGFDYLALFNMDTVVDERAVSELVRAAEADPKLGAVQARLMLHPETDKINSLGNATHYLGFGYTVGYKQPISNFQFPISNDIFYPSGAAVLFRAEALKEVGLFDEEYWMYNEDQELGWRLRLAGRGVALAPEAVVYHKFEFSRSIKRFYWMDRNRIISILKCYRLPTLVLILPAFILMELGLVALSIKGGWLGEKMKVYKYFLAAANWRKILKGRQEIQKFRKIKDREIAKLVSGKILFQEFDGPAMKLANIFFNFYWQLIKLIIVW